MEKYEESNLKQLPRRVYFVVKNRERWKDLLKGGVPPPIESLHHRFLDGSDAWTVQTYVQLRRRGLQVLITDQFIPGEICVTAYDDLAIGDFPYSSYVVCCRHERPRPEICEQRIVQNRLNIDDVTDYFLPCWIQPDLLSRDKKRGQTVKKVVYGGLDTYLANSFYSEEFLKKLSNNGFEFDIIPGSLEERDVNWSDYKEADVVLAVRNCSECDLALKPADKLINAWIAGCPALLGPEPAYRSLRKGDLDYIEVRNPDEALEALIKLKEHPDLYQAMIDNGFRRAKEFTPQNIARQWRDILAGPVYTGFLLWGQNSYVRNLITFLWRCIKHKKRIKEFKKQ